METFYNLLDTFQNKLKKRFKDFTTVIIFLRNSWNEQDFFSNLANLYGILLRLTCQLCICWTKF